MEALLNCDRVFSKILNEVGNSEKLSDDEVRIARWERTLLY